MKRRHVIAKAKKKTESPMVERRLPYLNEQGRWQIPGDPRLFRTRRRALKKMREEGKLLS